MTDEERMKGVNRLRERLTDADLQAFTLRTDPPKRRLSPLTWINAAMIAAIVVIGVVRGVM